MAEDILERRRKVADGGPPQTATAGPAIAAGGSAGGVGGVPAPASPQQQGTGFVGLDQYLAANRQGAQDMANKVAGAVEAKGQAGQQAVQGAQDAFAQKSQQAALAYDPSKATTSAQATVYANQGAYQGPRDYSEAGVDMAGTLQKASAGADAARALGTAGGVANALQESYNSGPTTAGGSALDVALTQAAGGSRFAQLQKMYGDLDSRFLTAAGGTQSAFDANAASTQAAEAQYGQRAVDLAQAERVERAQEEEAKSAAEAERRNQRGNNPMQDRLPRRRVGELP